MDEQHRQAVEQEAPGPEPDAALTPDTDAQGEPIVLRYSERQLLAVARDGVRLEELVTYEPARVVEVLERLGRIRAERYTGDRALMPGDLEGDVGVVRPLLPKLANLAAGVAAQLPTPDELAERRNPMALRDRVLDELADALDDALAVDDEDPHAVVRASTRVRQYAGAAASLEELVHHVGETAATPAPALDSVLAEVWTAAQALEFPAEAIARADGSVLQFTAAAADVLVEELRRRLAA